jgi:hypothetical protein
MSDVPSVFEAKVWNTNGSTPSSAFARWVLGEVITLRNRATDHFELFKLFKLLDPRCRHE